MNAFNLHAHIKHNYIDYLKSFLNIRDARIREKVEEVFNKSGFLPEPLIQFNPAYERGESLEDLSAQGAVHPDLIPTFGTYKLYRHQAEAIRIGAGGDGFVVTSGTGSGKSLTFLATVFDFILRQQPKPEGIKAILVYPMNALINSQEIEIAKYALNYLNAGLRPEQRIVLDEDNPKECIQKAEAIAGRRFPITFAQYTGQQDREKRDRVRELKPDILLTNYMMLELIMTRQSEVWLRELMADQLRFLVFDELHTYRGRQGSDVSMLIRRIRQNARQPITCIGTSATMSTKGSREERKKTIAGVASTIFGSAYNTSQVIGEYLEPSTDFTGRIPNAFELQEAINSQIDDQRPPDKFLAHPLTIWLENRIALYRHDDGFIERGLPLTLPQIADKLQEDSGETAEKCRDALMRMLTWTEALNKREAKGPARKSYLPFKLHQFISQTSALYVTLELRNVRQITVETTRYLKDKTQHDQLVFPVLFSRFSGHEFICVTKNYENKTLEPRDPDGEMPYQWTQDDIKGSRKTGKERRQLRPEDFPGGYLILPMEEAPEEMWTDEMLEQLPEAWWKKKGEVYEPEAYYRYQLPRKIWYNREGRFSDEPEIGLDQWAWYMPMKLLFDPTSGIVYDKKTNENTKLMRLGNEGRSTATTLLAYSVVKGLHEQGEKASDQKLLSFTDNRQDASLQAGHFNDFISTGQLRSALYHALKKTDGQMLQAHELAERVLKHLNLRESEYAKNPNDNWSDPENERALRAYILTRLLYDLRRSWRYNLPNLEQTALLSIEYRRLEEYSKLDDRFAGLPLFDTLNPEQRVAFILNILNFFRTSYALDYPVITSQRADLEGLMEARLDPRSSWGPDAGERIEIPYYLCPELPGPTQRNIYVASLGPNSYLGKYLKRKFKEFELHPLKSTEYVDYVKRLCEVLKDGNFLSAEDIKGQTRTVQGYRLRVDQILWKLGDGRTVVPDEVRLATFRDWQPTPNLFFKRFYQQDFSSLSKPIVGSEHTGQLTHSDRIEREKDFRAGTISSLFCSPTMELGIDIANLNIVHMRNVPPNPANYAQRSGRAGRSGQTALVYTYCSQGSPHDRNYFQKPTDMVSGAVAPPRIDQTNEELILSHFNAFLIMKCGIDRLRDSISDVLDLRDLQKLPVYADIRDGIEQGLRDFGQQWQTEFMQLIGDLVPKLNESAWFNEDALGNHLRSFYIRFDNAFNRWRVLYREADRLIQKARITIDNVSVKKDSPQMKEALGQHKNGLLQRELLRNNGGQGQSSLSEFYLFRYLASEGFLPGYNFTRLPIRAYMGHRYKEDGEYFSRPRFIALREFGPNNLIYHNGQKYRVNRLMLTDTTLNTQKLKASRHTSYAFLGEESDRYTNDPITGHELAGDEHRSYYTNLLELSESEAIPQTRISCEEEERMSTGFDLEQYFNYPKGMDSTRRAVIKSGAQPLLHLIFCGSTRLIQVNKRWRRSRDANGFYIDDRNGKWMREVDRNDEENRSHSHEIRLYTSTTADSLYIQPVKDLGIQSREVVSLAYALKRGLENQYQIEENEIGIWLMGRDDEPNIMLYEASEGSLGILSELVQKPAAMTELFAVSYQALHYDPATRQDRRPDLPKANYTDLLSYYNQRHHDLLDRHLSAQVLEKLMDCSIEPLTGLRDREAQYRYLLEQYDKNSSMEKDMIDHLYRQGYVLPDEAQKNVPECYVNADFIFRTSNGPVLLFCDGSVHDLPNVAMEDEGKRNCLIDHGYDMIVWHYRTPLPDLIESRKDVFRKII